MYIKNAAGGSSAKSDKGKIKSLQSESVPGRGRGERKKKKGGVAKRKERKLGCE